MSKPKHPLVELFQAAMRFRLGITKPQRKQKARRIPRLVYDSVNGPAQRVADENGVVTYRHWRGVTGGKWIKGANVVGAKVKLLEGDTR